jgi:beta-galactosidase
LLELETQAGPLCTAHPRPNLWRASTDNDGIKLWDGQDSKPLGRWLALGLDAASENDAVGLIETGKRGEPIVTTRCRITGRQGQAIGAFETRWIFDAQDSFLVRHRIDLRGPDLDDLPRVGVLWTLAEGLEGLRYFGLGPHENYPDRKSGALLGVHTGSVSSEYFPYVMPQETGHHVGTRWVELSSTDGRRLRFEFEVPLGFSALHFTPEMLFAGKKQNDLTPAPETFLCIDAIHRGLGTGSCGPDTLPEYRTGPGPHEWSYRVRIL